MQRFGRFALIVLEIFLLSGLILATRCANYRDVFVAGNAYYTDADCYARMTRARMCLAQPGLVVRHHDFENFPQGITPHTTAPFDYVIVALSLLLAPFTMHALDLAGAVVSPLLALAGGWFLWGWARQMKFRHRWPMLVLFAISPMLVHGTELGRPDHQSLLILLLLVALCGEWSLVAEPSRGWGVVAGCAWGLALWVSLYEPLILFALTVIVSCLFPGASSSRLFSRSRRAGWLCFLLLLALALLIERRLPSIAGLALDPLARNWTRRIGELQPVPLFNAIWFSWTGYLLVALPLLVWWQRIPIMADPLQRRRFALFFGSLGVTFLLTMAQARWGYFFVTVFAIALPVLLAPVRSRGVVWVVFLLSLWPVARAWDDALWPNEARTAQWAIERAERINLHELALTMKSSRREPFLAPWWLSPSLAYWSEQPAVAGSSHEGMDGIVETVRFYATDDYREAHRILESRQVSFVVACDADRTAENCAQILGHPIGEHALCYVLDRAPAQSPGFLVLAAQNPAGKLFRTANNR